MPRLHPTALIDPGAVVSDDVEVGPYAVIGPRVVIGPGCRLDPHVTVTGRTTLGRGVRVFAGAVLGTPPQDLKYAGEDTELVIGDDAVLREFVTCNTGTVQGGGRTEVGAGCLLMAYAHVAHDCRLGDRTILANNVMLAGHVHVGRHVTISGGSGFHHFVRVGDYAFVGGMSRCSQDVAPYLLTEGHPASAVTVNVVGLQRAGFSAEDVAALRAAHRRLYRGEGRRSETLERMRAETEHPACVRRLVEFLWEQMQGRNGRYLESLRARAPGA